MLRRRVRGLFLAEVKGNYHGVGAGEYTEDNFGDTDYSKSLEHPHREQQQDIHDGKDVIKILEYFTSPFYVTSGGRLGTICPLYLATI